MSKKYGYYISKMADLYYIQAYRCGNWDLSYIDLGTCANGIVLALCNSAYVYQNGSDKFIMVQNTWLCIPDGEPGLMIISDKNLSRGYKPDTIKHVRRSDLDEVLEKIAGAELVGEIEKPYFQETEIGVVTISGAGIKKLDKAATAQ